MILEVPAYKHITVSQNIDFTDRKICTLIGENGSGKSTFLESIFHFNDEYNIVSFSSGQNELFSKIYKNIRQSTFKKVQDIDSSLENIKKYHFDLEFSRILIFMASIFKNGNTRQYLINKNYIENINDLKIAIDFELPSYYIHAYSDALDKEALDYEHSSVRNTYIHAYLEKIIAIKINDKFDFDNPLSKRSLEFSSSEMLNVFQEKDSFKTFTFIGLTNNANKAIFDYKTTKLYFNELEFENLSDGEFQLLSIYSLIDLFDNENTIFLLDEIDSHLHYKNINNLWNRLKNISGKVVTTTHSYESIIINEFEDINYIENGNIKYYEKDIELFEKLSSITSHNNYGFKISSQKENIVLIDDLDDWIIFKKLVLKKFGNEAIEVLNKITPYKKTSNYDNSSQIFGHGKLNFVKEISQLDFDINTKNFFLICDRDKLEEDLIRDNLEVNIHNNFNSIKRFNNENTKTFLLSWKRLEIENYLISKTMLETYGLFDNFKSEFDHLNFNSIENFDNISDIKKHDCKSITHPLYKEDGFNESNLDILIDKIPPEEISEDIVKMYNFIKSKI